ncbi:MAG: response regulator transcription factor [Deltaproteobacteria bacterium]|nr:response regulator transcription factor [Deltaproteobacteria bacterium]
MARILLCDDHEIVVLGLSRILSEHGFEVVESSKDGFELYEKITSIKPDVSIVDFKMPGFGLDELRKICKLGDVKIVVLTAVTEKLLLKQIADCGVAGILTKQAEKDEIIFCLNAVLKNKKYFTPDVLSILLEKESSQNGQLEQLSEREIEILKLIAEGYSNKEIGRLLNLSSRTIDSHRSNIIKKLKVRNNQDLVKLALRNHLIELN